MTELVAAQSKPTLIKIFKQANEISEHLAESGGEVSPEMEQLIADVEMATIDKADGYGFVIARLESEEEFFKHKADSYAQIARSMKNMRERMKARIKQVMTETNNLEVIGNEYKFKLSTSAERLLIDEKALPVEYTDQVISQVPNKERIKEALIAMHEIPGAKLEGGLALRITTSRKAVKK